MQEEILPAGASAWLRSPVSENADRLQPLREITVRPYVGAERRLRIHRKRILVGQSAECDVRIEDPFLCPRHAEILLEPGGRGYVVRDLGSRNGVFLNGVRVEAAPLPSQGSLRLGRSTLTWVRPVPEVGEGDLILADPRMREIVDGLRRVAGSNLPVLLLGETGTGKDVLARLVHRWGAAPEGPFVPVNGALTGGTLAESELFGHRKGAYTGAESPRLGALRSAHGGTLFLDEVADVPSCAQVKLLRALEIGEVKALGADTAERAEFRLITATSRNLEGHVRRGEFRLDLYYRIAGFVAEVPPLRERPLDVLAIARHFARARSLELEPEGEGRLLSYAWPGNVRELRSSLERAAVLARHTGSPCLLAEHFASLGGSTLTRAPGVGAPRKLWELEKEIVQKALERHGWSKKLASEELGIARSSLYAKMRRLGVRDEAGAPRA